LKCAPKKSKIPPKFFVSSKIPSVSAVGIRADGHVSGMRGPSVMLSVFNVGNSVGIRADGHVACMRCPSVMPSVLTVGKCRRYTCRRTRVRHAFDNPSVIPSVVASDTPLVIRR